MFNLFVVTNYLIALNYCNLLKLKKGKKESAFVLFTENKHLEPTHKELFHYPPLNYFELLNE